MFNLPIILAIVPFLVFLILLLWAKVSLLKTSLWTLGLFTLLSIFYWQVSSEVLWISYAKGFFVAFDIFIIIFGAIFFLEILEWLGVIENISYYLEHFSRDYRVQIIILAWFFENFIEGTAGFGTPVAIVAPLLVGLGLSPIKALAVSLLGNSTSVVFGAAGTPIRAGFAGLDVASVPVLSALINCVGFIVPIFMLWIMTVGRVNRKKEFFDAVPFAIWSGLIFVVPSLVIATFFGQELPSIIGSVIGLILVEISIKLKIFMPKEELSLKERKPLTKSMSAWQVIFPYSFLIILLIAGKLFLGQTSLKLHFIVDYAFSLFNPGFAFIIAGLVVIAIWKGQRGVFNRAVTDAFKGTIGPFLVIVSMSAFVQLMINSGQNTSGLASAISLMSKAFETNWLPFFAPFVGAFGSFITGSATISNIMFGNFFSLASEALSLNTGLILSLGVVGAGAGNMIALSDMLAGEAVVGLKNHERQVLKEVAIPCFTYLILVGIVGMLMV